MRGLTYISSCRFIHFPNITFVMQIVFYLPGDFNVVAILGSTWQGVSGEVVGVSRENMGVSANIPF